MLRSSESRLGVGVVGLHEGLTLLKALTHTVPDALSTSRIAVNDEQTRCQFAYAVAGCDLDQKKCDRVSELLPGLPTTTDFGVLLERDDIQIIAIYTPDATHAELIEQAMRAGKHVICTKPLVVTIEGAKRIKKASDESGMRLQVGQSTRFFPPFVEQRAAFLRNELGSLDLIDTHYIHRMDWFYEKSPWAKDTTDWVFLGMSHPLDLLTWYGGAAESVSAIATRSALAKTHGTSSNDIYCVNVTFESGVVGRALGHYGLVELPSARNAIECVLFGDRGTSQAQYHDMRYRQTLADGAEMTVDRLYVGRGPFFNNEVHGMHYGEFAAYTDHFARALIYDESNDPDLISGLETFALMEAIRRSVLSCESVFVGDIRREIGLD
ncbi:MAG: Gfo/Idh/MocA family oxidoreductase [Fimbriimonadaceae bacterium]|nr:Gfo/Idh/MocA family oxidoreductase [Fimbriimonadaceae bacterium]